MKRSRATQKEREELIQKNTALAEAEQSRKKIETILSLMPAAVYTCDAQGRLTFYNERAAELWGRKPSLNDDGEKFSGAFRLWRSDGAPLSHSEAPMAQAIKTGQEMRNHEVTMERPDGSRIVASVNTAPLFDQQGRLTGAINVFQDITGLNRAEHASHRLAAIVESSDDAIVSKDLNGVIMSWNQGAQRLFGYTASEAIGKSITILIPAEHRDEEDEILGRIRRGERIDHFETVRQRKDGGLVEISLTVSPIKNAKGSIIGASKIARDITERNRVRKELERSKEELAKANQELEIRVRERTTELEQANAALVREMEEQKRLQEQLRHAQKMEGVGTLAGGIAHDFNNILNIMKGYTTLLGRHASGDARVTDSVKVIDESIERGARLVRQMLTLARKSETRLAAANANDLISDLCKILNQTFPKTITISLDLNPKLPSLMVDANQITQVLLNLSVNARDAMSSGGRLVFRTKIVDGREVPVSELTGSHARRYACIEVCDTGIGMDENVRRRLFEPFFTTKGVGEGTGLGLAMAYGIIKNHDGFIDVDSERGRGTTFRLYLPLRDSDHPELRATVDSNGKPLDHQQKGHGTVLLVEDEENMVHLVQDLLECNGYRVLPAFDGAQAISLYEDHHDEIDLVLLDLGLPKVAGWDVIQKIQQQNPKVSILVASGYIEPEIKSRMDAAGVKRFLYKPYLPDDVVRTVHELLLNR